VPHLLGAAKLLKMYRTMRPKDDLVKMMARSTCMDEASYDFISIIMVYSDSVPDA
jgi:hypothetical protein